MTNSLKTCVARSGGYITLVSVLVFGAVGIALVVVILSVGLSTSLTGFSVLQSRQSHALADSCAESALAQVRESTSYTGTETLTFTAGSCTYTVMSTGGQNRLINSFGTVGGVVSKVQVFLDQINPRINIVYWQDVADF